MRDGSKKWRQSSEQVQALIDTGETLQIVSGEGNCGNIETYTGPRTVGHLMARCKIERAGGDRWARGETVSGHALCGVI